MVRKWLTSSLAFVLFVSLGTGVASAGPNQAGGKGGLGAGRPDPEKMKKIIAKFDTDGDGKLSESERQAARAARGKKGGAGGPQNPEQMKKLIARFDTDGDGKLSESERQAARAARGKNRKKQS